MIAVAALVDADFREFEAQESAAVAVLPEPAQQLLLEPALGEA